MCRGGWQTARAARGSTHVMAAFVANRWMSGDVRNALNVLVGAPVVLAAQPGGLGVPVGWFSVAEASDVDDAASARGGSC
ncbi:MAG: hypothetical protein IPM55_08255 [Acidobacteria bacterium]|nr:hypothetical protein [Acidobacteriota bacterium]